MKRSHKLTLGAVALFIVVANLGLLDDDAPSNATASVPVDTVASAKTPSRIDIQTDSRIALQNFLKDPSSADIRNHNGMCGEVNSKNSFGAYTGYKRFVASSAIVVIDGENIESSEFEQVWQKTCA